MLTTALHIVASNIRDSYQKQQSWHREVHSRNANEIVVVFDSKRVHKVAIIDDRRAPRLHLRLNARITTPEKAARVSNINIHAVNIKYSL
ncbi:hypothetical protein DFJ66_4644 [Saccharothrix variisporea]|uniref:Uncharacterized protein n=1 Tax=Saccharothrix variisporea TaxID=543527 RepID=A0A495XE00_9PSEU|nr:hypothetical protein DFJ66_4644 [Saccharothrix variisporea]